MRRPTSPPRRRSSSLERVAEPNVLVTYLCGYSLRTCTSFILWIEVVSTRTFSRSNSLSEENISLSYHNRVTDPTDYISHNGYFGKLTYAFLHYTRTS